MNVNAMVPHLIKRWVFVCLLLANSGWFIRANVETIPENFELQVKLRMRSMNCMVAPRLNDEVKFYLNRYIFKHPRITERMLGRAALYFPIFEKILQEKGLPTELKALSILESWLDQGATSRVGAGGLWQLMPQTARMYGLTVNNAIDERRDIYRSTEAALNLLIKLHEIYKDWGIALAAYNAGPLRVNRAIDKAGGSANSFWTIAPYLPKETQHFVPKFIAFSYLIQFYAEHEIFPEFPDLDLQFIDVIKVHQKLSFKEVSNITGIEQEVLRNLNPSYKQNFIPASTQGFNLVLPARLIPLMEEYLNLTDKNDRNTFISDLKIIEETEENQNVWKSNYVETYYIVEEDDDLDRIAAMYYTDAMRIKLWNHLTGNYPQTGQRLTLFIPIDIYFDKIALNASELEFICIPPDKTLESKNNKNNFCLPASYMLGNEEFKKHKMSYGQTWLDICKLYDLQDISELQSNNKMDKKEVIRPGMHLQIRTVKNDGLVELIP